MITHIVLFKLAEPTAEGIATVSEKLLSMQGKIPMLRYLEVGKDIVGSLRSYDVALITKFDSMEDLDSYQIHPYHSNDVVPVMKSICSSIVSVDFES